MTRVTFNKINDGFFDELKEKINGYFSRNKIKRTGSRKIYKKSIIIISIAVASYAMLLFCAFPVWASVILCVVLGASFAGIGFNIMHDGAHGSFSSKKWINELAGYSLNLMGGNVFIWKNKHNSNHHNYTNIDSIDDDIDIEPWMRTHANQPRRWFHRYQHIYGLMLYGLTYFNWIFTGDLKKYFSKKIADTDLAKMNGMEHFIFWISKAVFLSLFLITPIFVVGFWKAIIGFAITLFVCGIILGVVFQLAHLTDDAEFPVPSEDTNKMEQNWVLHQIATTVNFAPNNRAIFWLTGGLNFQLVHHIFPKISHVHYPQINELIKETCDKFNVKYTEYPTFWGALCAHLSYLKRMGVAA